MNDLIGREFGVVTREMTRTAREGSVRREWKVIEEVTPGMYRCFLTSIDFSNPTQGLTYKTFSEYEVKKYLSDYEIKRKF